MLRAPHTFNGHVAKAGPCLLPAPALQLLPPHSDLAPKSSATVTPLFRLLLQPPRVIHRFLRGGVPAFEHVLSIQIATGSNAAAEVAWEKRVEFVGAADGANVLGQGLLGEQGVEGLAPVAGSTDVLGYKLGRRYSVRFPFECFDPGPRPAEVREELLGDTRALRQYLS